LFDTLTFAEILVGTTFLGTPTLTVLVCRTCLETIPSFYFISLQAGMVDPGGG
jgi:hypothetical protein